MAETGDAAHVDTGRLAADFVALSGQAVRSCPAP